MHYCNNKILYKTYKFVICFIVCALILNLNIAFAKKKSGGEVEAPTAENTNKVQHSEAIIVNKGMAVLDPLHTDPPGFDKDEYDSVNNYVVDFNTLESRIKYFSPRYNTTKMDLITNNVVSAGSMGIDINGITSNYIDKNTGSLLMRMESVVSSVKDEIINCLMSYNNYNTLLKQNELYTKLLSLANENLSLGLITYDEYNSINNDATKTMYNLDIATSTMNRNKEIVAKDLGYSLSEIDKITFNEPTIDDNYILSIDFDKDLSNMVDRDANYISVLFTGDEGSDGHSSIPGSTGEVIYNKKLSFSYENARMKYESLYANLINKYRLYDNNRKYLSRIIALEEVENNSKFSSSLISETDYIKKEIDILNNKNKLLESKYDLLKVYNNYYYSVLLY